MTTNKRVVAAAIAGLAGLVATQCVLAAEEATEKCYGVSKAGKNDCAGAKHACQGQSKESRSLEEFIKLPSGTCERIQGGTLSAPAKK